MIRVSRSIKFGRLRSTYPGVDAHMQARPEEGASGAVCHGPQPQEGPQAQAEERLPQHTDQFISFMFQMKIK